MINMIVTFHGFLITSLDAEDGLPTGPVKKMPPELFVVLRILIIFHFPLISIYLTLFPVNL